MTESELKQEVWLYPKEVGCYIEGVGWGRQKQVTQYKNLGCLTILFEFNIKGKILKPVVEYIFQHELLYQITYCEEYSAGDVFRPMYMLQMDIRRDRARA